MNRACRRLVASAVLLGWLAPGALALTGVLHLAARELGAGHDRDLLDLARSATHGHHHDQEAAPEHDHDATLEAGASAVRPLAASGSVAAFLPLPSVAGVEASRFQAASRRGPPAPLFRTHCALLL